MHFNWQQLIKQTLKFTTQRLSVSALAAGNPPNHPNIAPYTIKYHE